MDRRGSTLNRATAALSALLAVALAARVVWELLRPLVPVLLVVLSLSFVYSQLLRRY